MKLDIVWRNPQPPERPKWQLQRIVLDQFGALYSVMGSDFTEKYEVIAGGNAA